MRLFISPLLLAASLSTPYQAAAEIFIEGANRALTENIKAHLSDLAAEALGYYRLSYQHQWSVDNC